jgi:hypothetical protein
MVFSISALPMSRQPAARAKSPFSGAPTGPRVGAILVGAESLGAAAVPGLEGARLGAGELGADGGSIATGESDRRGEGSAARGDGSTTRGGLEGSALGALDEGSTRGALDDGSARGALTLGAGGRGLAEASGSARGSTRGGAPEGRPSGRATVKEVDRFGASCATRSSVDAPRWSPTDSSRGGLVGRWRPGLAITLGRRGAPAMSSGSTGGAGGRVAPIETGRAAGGADDTTGALGAGVGVGALGAGVGVGALAGAEDGRRARSEAGPASSPEVGRSSSSCSEATGIGAPRPPSAASSALASASRRTLR